MTTMTVMGRGLWFFSKLRSLDATLE
jgi:hypothetical protein